MSALDVSDPFISMAYDALAQNNPLRWFLLAYGNKPNQLCLCASGPGDIDELRTHITPGNVHYGIFREYNNDSILCVALAIIPDSVRGVHRARALVHANTISSMFKTHQTLNASSAEQITIDALRSSLRLPPRGPEQVAHNQHTSSSPPPSTLSPSGSSPPTALTAHSASPTPPAPSRSLRKPPPRLSVAPTVKRSASDRENLRTGSPPRTPSEPSPSAIRRPSAPSPQTPHSPTASSPPVLSSSSHDAMTAVPPSSLHKPMSRSDSHKALWLEKQRVPLPQPPAVPVPAQNAESPQEPRAAFGPSSAFESDDDESSEIDYGVQMRGPLSDIANSDLNRGPTSPIGSIPSEPSLYSGASTRKRSPKLPVQEPSSPHDEHKHITANGTLSDASAPRTPAQEEAARARNGWAVQVKQTIVNEELDRPPPPPAKETPVYSRKDEVSRTRSALGHGAAPHVGVNDTERPVTRRRAATEDGLSRAVKESHTIIPSAENLAPRRIASQDTQLPPPAPAPRSRFLERASPETLVEEQRLITLDDERRRRAAERAQREREERVEEEARERAFAERKEREHARRIQLVRQGEARRAEERRLEEEARLEQEAKEARERREREMKDREVRARARQHIEKVGSGMELLSGFVTIEMTSVWRRRYFRLSTESWHFFRDDKDEAQAVHVIELSRVRALREWNEGYEELKAIPHSFAVELMDDEPLPCFADSGEDKEILLGLLNQAAGL